jgi:hypothetical protein
MNKLITTASLVALMTIPALAQTTAPSPMPAEHQDMSADKAPAKAAYTGEIFAKDLLNTSVKNSANDTVGDINDLVLDGNGKISAVIVGVGGFLGLGEKNVALPFEQLAFGRDSNGNLAVTANVTKESLQTAPEWKKPADTDR